MLLTNPFLFRKTVRLSVAKASFALAPQPAVVKRSFRLQVTGASLAVSGKTVALKKASRITVPVRTYAIAPVASRVLVGRKISATTRSWLITGLSAILQKSRVAGFVKTEFYATGQAVNLKRGYKLSATSAAFAVTPRSVGMLKIAGQITVLPASLAVAGQQMLLKAARKLTLINATYSMTGQIQRLIRTYPLQANPAAFAIDGKSANLKMGRIITAVKSDWIFAQPAVTLTYTQNSLQLSLVGSAGSAVGSVTNTTLALGMTTNAGDIICVVCRNSGGSGTDATMSGYTRAWRGPNSSAATRYYLFYKVSPGGETTVPTLSNSLAHRKMASVYRPNQAVTPIVSVLSLGLTDGVAAQTTGDPAAQVHNVTTGTFPKIAMGLYSGEGSAVTTRTLSVNGADAADVELSTSGATWFYGKTRAFNAAQVTDVTIDMPDVGENVLASVLLGITT